MQLLSFSGLLLVAICVNVCQAKPTDANHEKFSLNIQEKGSEFQQEVDLDEKEGIVTVHVPQHNDVDETYFITDTKKHLTMRVAPLQKMCFLTEHDPEELPSADVWRQTRDSVQDLIISNQEIETKKIVYEIVSKLSDDERDSLPKQMQKSCTEFPVVIVRPMDFSPTQDSTLFSKDEFTIIDMPNRVKRHEQQGDQPIIYIDMCPPDKIKQKCLLMQHGCKYAYDRICDTHVDVSGRESTQCNLKHWSGQVICCKPCCLDKVPDGNPSLHCHDPRLHRDAICE